ncbi:MAG: hypothetical protein KQA40_03150 [Candidatus Aenigmarchaeota archaeon]|nr:hypothetical protein [Candidatus Aenigmarchaeota archaeon]
MKKILILLFILLISTPVTAKSIVYISSSNVGNCDSLPTIDKYFCNRLISLGYDVKIIWENNVRDNSGDWPSASEDANLIFIGNISNDMINTSRYQSQFCGNISAANKPIFSVLNSNYKKADLRGCAFDILPISYSTDNNTCYGTITGVFYVIKEGYLTYDYKINDDITLYSQNLPVYIHGEHDSNVGWVSVNCQPQGSSSGKYSILNTSDKGVFFGLTNPQYFTPEAWKLFDKSIYYILDDWRWDYKIKAIPNFTNEILSSKNVPLYIFLNITRSGFLIENETIKVNISNSTHSFNYSIQAKNLKNFTLNFNTSDIYSVNLTGEGGSYVFQIKVGSLNILFSEQETKSYTPGKPFNISVFVFNNSNSFLVDEIYYKIYYSNFTEITNGTISEVDNNKYYVNITPEDWGDIFLAVYAKNSTTNDFGINYTKVSRASYETYTTLSTNKNIIVPGEDIEININSQSIISSANLTHIIGPNGNNLILSPIPMTCSGKTCTLSWATSKTYPQGNFIIKAKVNICNSIFDLSNNFTIKAWDIKASLLKTILFKNDTISLSIQAYNVYDNNLKINIKTTIIDPSNKETILEQFTFSGDTEYNITKKVNETWSVGNYKLKIFVNDSEGRNWTQILNFTIYEIGSVYIIPLEWVTVKNDKGIYNQTFFIYNNGTEPITIYSISLLQNLSSFSYYTSQPLPYILNPGKTFNFTLFVNITNIGIYQGNIIVNTSYILFSVPILVEYRKEILESYLEITPITKIITVSDRIEIREFEIKNNADFNAVNITYETDENIKLKDLPEIIGAGETKKVKLEINTSGYSEGTKYHQIKIYSSVGNASISITIKILGNVLSILNEKEEKINLLMQNLTKISNKTAIDEILSIINEIKATINKTKESFQDENFEDTDKYLSQIDSLLTKTDQKYSEALQLEAITAQARANLIYLIAYVVIFIIILITLFKYRKQIKEFINKFIKKEKPKEEEFEEKPKEEPEEEKIFIEPGQYRTEYY